jgi:hypothetical protein
MPAFARPIGIDYSGAETRTASLKGLRVYLAEGDAPPAEIVPPPPSPMEYWTRRGISEWLVDLGALPSVHRNCPLCFPHASPLDEMSAVSPTALEDNAYFSVSYGGGRDRDRTCDPSRVKGVLSR